MRCRRQTHAKLTCPVSGQGVGAQALWLRPTAAPPAGGGAQRGAVRWLWAGHVPWLKNFTFMRVEGTVALGELGVLFLMFMIGLELEPAKLWRMRGPIFGLGGMQVVPLAFHQALAEAAAERVPSTETEFASGGRPRTLMPTTSPTSWMPAIPGSRCKKLP